jgi:hypothetical protein
MDLMMDNHSYTRDWEKLQEILRQFFWYEPLAEEWRLCWIDGIKRRLAQKGYVISQK